MTATDISELLLFSIKQVASDLHLSAGEPPLLRIHGDMRKLEMDSFEQKDGNHSWPSSVIPRNIGDHIITQNYHASPPVSLGAPYFLEVPLVMKSLWAGEALIVRNVDDLEKADRDNFLRYGTRASKVLRFSGR